MNQYKVSAAFIMKSVARPERINDLKKANEKGFCGNYDSALVVHPEKKELLDLKGNKTYPYTKVSKLYNEAAFVFTMEFPPERFSNDFKLYGNN